MPDLMSKTYDGGSGKAHTGPAFFDAQRSSSLPITTLQYSKASASHHFNPNATQPSINYENLFTNATPKVVSNRKSLSASSSLPSLTNNHSKSMNNLNNNNTLPSLQYNGSMRPSTHQPQQSRPEDLLSKDSKDLMTFPYVGVQNNGQAMLSRFEKNRQLIEDSNKLSKKNKKRNNVIKLPVFKLPSAVDAYARQAQALAANNTHNNSVFIPYQAVLKPIDSTAVNSNQFINNFIPYTDIKSMRKTFLNLLLNMGEREREYVTNLIGLYKNEYNELITHIKKKTNENNINKGGYISNSITTDENILTNPASTNQNNFRDTILNYFISIEDCITINNLCHNLFKYALSPASATSSTAALNPLNKINHTSSTMSSSLMKNNDSVSNPYEIFFLTSSTQDLLNAHIIMYQHFLYFIQQYHNKRQNDLLNSPELSKMINITDSFQSFIYENSKKKNNNESSNNLLKLKDRPSTSSSSASNLLSLTSPNSSSKIASIYGGGKKKKKQENETNSLTNELLSSLMTVQKHATAVKKSLEFAQSLMNEQEQKKNNTLNSLPLLSSSSHSLPSITMNNSNNCSTNNLSLLSSPELDNNTSRNQSKAHKVVTLLAAEKFIQVFQKLIFRKLKTAFFAWKFYLSVLNKSDRYLKLLRIICLRNISQSFSHHLLLLLSYNFNKLNSQCKLKHQQLQIYYQNKMLLKLQSFFRMILAKKYVKYLRQKRRYEKFYSACIILQKIIRGFLSRAQYKKMYREFVELKSAQFIQRIYRGYVARKYVKQLQLENLQLKSATKIQCFLRQKYAYKRLLTLKEDFRRNKAAIRIQTSVRKYLVLKHFMVKKIELIKSNAATKIQAMVRGYILRKNFEFKKRELEALKALKHKNASKIQAIYRGYRTRIQFAVQLLQYQQEVKRMNNAATIIGKRMRGYLARALVKDLLHRRYLKYIQQAKQCKEIYDEVEQQYKYYLRQNEETASAFNLSYLNKENDEIVLYEPPPTGYTRADGLLVLQNGAIIEDPDAIKQNPNSSNSESSLANDEKNLLKDEKVKFKSKLCSECNTNYAPRLCNQCGDQFCIPCYKMLHMLVSNISLGNKTNMTNTRGGIRDHTFSKTSVLVCDNCEVNLSEKFCNNCSEHFCDECFKKVHHSGKRVYHAFQQVNGIDGRIQKRIFRLDGEEVSFHIIFLDLLYFLLFLFFLLG